MGWERGSTTRLRLAGNICCFCGIQLDAPPWSSQQRTGERSCSKCEVNRPRHRILMNFMHRNGWHISFLEADCKTSLPRKYTFATADKIFQMATRGGAEMTSDLRSSLNHGIEIGRGGVWLFLTESQYRLLARPGP